MEPNCRGCEEEWITACDYVKDGYHFATTKKRTGIGEQKHLAIIIVDDKGRIIVS